MKGICHPTTRTTLIALLWLPFATSLRPVTLLRLSSVDAHPIVTGVTLKIALDANGGAANLAAGQSERFTCAESLDMVHRLRCDSDAVLIGRATVQADDPSLTVRRVKCDHQPLRVVLDPSLRLLGEQMADNYVLFADGLPTVVYHCVEDVDDSLLDLNDSITCVCLPRDENGDLNVAEVVASLSKRFGVNHLMVEGGPQTARRFLAAKLIDRALVVKAPLCFKEPLPSGIDQELLERSGLQLLGSSPSGDDQIDYWTRPNLLWPTEKLSDWP